MSFEPKSILLLGAVILVLSGGGCATTPNQTRPVGPKTESPQAATESSATRFQDTPLKGRTAVESAIELSEKYARLSDQTVSLREENQRLTSENERLRQQITALEGKLLQTQKELGEANELLIEMLTELNNWKTNILGFRSEMREAAKAELEALLKVLEILGGEAEAGTLERRHAATLKPEQYGVQEPNEPVTSLMTGEPNELP
jgi:chromosome segregation ATPase